MPNSLHIVPGKQADKLLNKEQKRFNNLVKKISNLRQEIEQMKELDMELRRLGEEKIKPAEKKALQIARDWVLVLHNHPAKHLLSNKQSQRFNQIMVEETQRVLMTQLFENDVELQEIYTFYEGSGRSYEEILDEIELDEKALTVEMMNEMFGMDISLDDVDDVDAMFEKMAADEEKHWEEAKQRYEKQNTRKKSASAQAAQEKREAAQASVNKTAKQLYLDLVRHFHPDKEPDELKRAEKTEIMKQITVAYEANDHLKLLELQMSLLNARENAFADFNNDQLKYFNQTLQQQLFNLEQELFFSSPEGNGNPYFPFFEWNRLYMQQNIERHVRQIKSLEKQTLANIDLIRQEKLFKEFVRDYLFEEEDEMW
jgi:hypothetical protein